MPTSRNGTSASRMCERRKESRSKHPGHFNSLVVMALTPLRDPTMSQITPRSMILRNAFLAYRLAGQRLRKAAVARLASIPETNGSLSRPDNAVRPSL
jgi:hypothetical protein